MNNQPIEKRRNDVADGQFLEVHSIFYTIQGEGPFCGTPAVFIRLAGCNLQCPLCDTDYTRGREVLSIEDILKRVDETPLKKTGLVVITGGEPFRQGLESLLIHLVATGRFVQIETNGTLPPPLSRNILWSLDISKRFGVYIVCAPKTGKINDVIRTLACAFKYVVHEKASKDDGLPYTVLDHTANPMVARPRQNALVYVQPADEKDARQNERNLHQAIKSCMEYGHILQLQIHKIIGLE